MTRVAPPRPIDTLVPGPTPHAAVVDAQGEAIVVDEKRERLHLLNPSGALVWSLLDGVSTVGDIADDLADALDLDPAATRTEVAALVRHLLDADLAVATGYERAPSPEELASCDCGETHLLDDVDIIEIPGNP